MRRVWIALALVALTGVIAPRSAGAQVSLPPVNLGGDFLDGVAGPGVLVQQFVEHYDGSIERAQSRARVAGMATLTHVAWLTHARLLGGYAGTEVLVPVARLRVRSGGRTLAGSGVGDVSVSPLILQWNHERQSRRVFSHRLALPVTVPTASYDHASALSIGRGHWRVNPYWAFTVMPTTRWEVSARLMYLWNGAREASERTGRPEEQAGQAFHANYAASYEARPWLRLGAAGYVLQQSTPHREAGRPVADSRERILSVGPGIMLTSGFTKLTVHAFFEGGETNRPAGTKVLVRMAKAWPTH